MYCIRSADDTFSAGQAAAIGGVPYYTLNNWALAGFIQPSAEQVDAPEAARAYSFADLVALKICGSLRNLGASCGSLAGLARHLQGREYGRIDECFVLVGGDGEIAEVSAKDMRRKLPDIQSVAWVVNLSAAVKEVDAAAKNRVMPKRGRACLVAR